MATTRPVPAPAELASTPTYTWYGCDLKTGKIVEEIPFEPGGSLQRILGAYSSLQGAFPVADAAGDWKSATDPGRTMLVCVRDDDEMPLWAGIVIGRSGGSDEYISLSLVTLEGYYDRRFVKDRVETHRAGQQIAVDLVFDADNVEGIGMTFPTFFNSAPYHDRTYSADSDQTVYSQLTELMGVEDGPEWTIDVIWSDATKTAFTKRFLVDLSIGNNFDTGDKSVNAIFDYPGCIRSYELKEDYSSSKSATHVEIFGDGEGETRPSGTPGRAEALIAAGWPRYEYRRTISGATQASTLTAHAKELVAWMGSGAQIYTVEANAATAPKLGADWMLGAYVGVQIAESPRHPDGVDILARAIGWELDTVNGTVTPLLEEEDADA
ncbi:hypothetical protein [Kribbella sandramycini]|nr:hypothetical protein [Kribbella sandramycini]